MVVDTGIIQDKLLKQDAYKTGITRFAVGAGVLKGSSLLLVHRAAHDFLGGLWEIPGGGVGKDESFLQAVTRELKEETGLGIKTVQNMFTGFDYVNSSKKKVRQYNYLVTVAYTSVRLDPREHDAYAWVGKTDLDQYPMTEQMHTCILSLF
jgi:8-oxo-dGTP diphosphatase